MEKCFVRGFVALATALAFFVPIAIGSSIEPAGADNLGTCIVGSPVLSGADFAVTLQVGTTPDPSAATTYVQTQLGAFAPAEGQDPVYSLTLCRDSSNNVYSYSIGRLISGIDASGQSSLMQSPLTSSDLSLFFTISFTPLYATDVPLTSENHALVTAFSIDPHTHAVAVTLQPLRYSAIDGCQFSPDVCSSNPQYPGQTCASSDPSNPWGIVCTADANLTGSIRYQDTTQLPGSDGSAGFNNLPGMALSSGAFEFYVNAACPAALDAGPGGGLQIALSGPQYEQDGSTPNTPLVQFAIPATALESCFGADPLGFIASNPQITRTFQNGGGSDGTMTTSAGSDPGLTYAMVASPDDSSLTVTVQNVTFAPPALQGAAPLLARSDRPSAPRGPSALAPNSAHATSCPSSSDATLKGLATSVGLSNPLQPQFSAMNTSYGVVVAPSTTSIQVIPTKNLCGGSIKVNGTTVASGSAQSISLARQSSTIAIVVTASNQKVTKTYTLTVARDTMPRYSINSGTSRSLAIQTKSLGTLFNSSLASHHWLVAKVTRGGPYCIATSTAVLQVRVTPSPLLCGYSITDYSLSTVNHVTKPTAGASKVGSFALVNSDATLKALGLSAGSLSPAFNAAQNAYTSTVSAGTSSVVVTPVANATGATIKVNGTALTSLVKSTTVALGNHGSTTSISIVVTATDAKTTKTYVVKVTRSAH